MGALLRSTRTSSETGFTLVELLVVFSMLALLLSIAAPRYLRSLDDSKVKVQAQNMATIRDALDKFKADQGRYPAELPELVAKKYLRQVPVDPVTGSAAWAVTAHPQGEPGVYDVQPPAIASEAPAAEPAPATASK